MCVKSCVQCSETVDIFSSNSTYSVLISDSRLCPGYKYGICFPTVGSTDGYQRPFYEISLSKQNGGQTIVFRL